MRGYVLGCKFAFHFADWEMVGDLAPPEPKLTQKVTVSIFLKDQRVMSRGRVVLGLVGYGVQARASIANRQNATVEGCRRFHLVFASGNNLVGNHKVKWYLYDPFRAVGPLLR